MLLGKGKSYQSPIASSESLQFPVSEKYRVFLVRAEFQKGHTFPYSVNNNLIPDTIFIKVKATPGTTPDSYVSLMCDPTDIQLFAWSRTVVPQILKFRNRVFGQKDQGNVEANLIRERATFPAMHDMVRLAINSGFRKVPNVFGQSRISKRSYFSLFSQFSQFSQ